MDPGHLKWLTDACLIGLGPVLCFGYFVSYFCLRIQQHRALKKIRYALVYTFMHAHLHAHVVTARMQRLCGVVLAMACVHGAVYLDT